MDDNKASPKLSLKMSKEEANEAMRDTLSELKSRTIPNLLIGIGVAVVAVAIYAAFLT